MRTRLRTPLLRCLFLGHLTLPPLLLQRFPLLRRPVTVQGARLGLRTWTADEARVMWGGALHKLLAGLATAAGLSIGGLRLVVLRGRLRRFNVLSAVIPVFPAKNHTRKKRLVYPRGPCMSHGSPGVAVLEASGYPGWPNGPRTGLTSPWIEPYGSRTKPTEPTDWADGAGQSAGQAVWPNGPGHGTPGGCVAGHTIRRGSIAVTMNRVPHTQGADWPLGIRAPVPRGTSIQGWMSPGSLRTVTPGRPPSPSQVRLRPEHPSHGMDEERVSPVDIPSGDLRPAYTGLDCSMETPRTSEWILLDRARGEAQT